MLAGVVDQQALITRAADEQNPYEGLQRVHYVRQNTGGFAFFMQSAWKIRLF
jgi:hypothetical protein